MPQPDWTAMNWVPSTMNDDGWPITPAVTFSVSLTGQTVLRSETLSPKPAVDGCASLRFYLGSDARTFSKSPASYGTGGPGEYEGFRYPYGFPPGD